MKLICIKCGETLLHELGGLQYGYYLFTPGLIKDKIEKRAQRDLERERTNMKNHKCIDLIT